MEERVLWPEVSRNLFLSAVFGNSGEPNYKRSTLIKESGRESRLANASLDEVGNRSVISLSFFIVIMLRDQL